MPFNAKVTIQDIEYKNARNGSQYATLSYNNEQGQDFKLTTFSTSLLSDVNKGDVVVLELEKNGKYTNLLGVEKSTNTKVGDASASNTSGGNKSEEIAKAVAMKAAVAIVSQMVTSKSDLMKMSQDVLTTADEFVEWLLTPQSERVAAVMEAMAAELGNSDEKED